MSVWEYLLEGKLCLREHDHSKIILQLVYILSQGLILNLSEHKSPLGMSGVTYIFPDQLWYLIWGVLVDFLKIT